MTTNYERIKNMTVGELAEFLKNSGAKCIQMYRKKNGVVLPCIGDGEGCTPVKCFTKWLQSESEA